MRTLPHAPGGEHVHLDHRLVIAPAAGRFEPDPSVGDEVQAGDRVGWVHHAGATVAVGSAWSGRFMGHLAEQGERVRDAQPLAWISLDGDLPPAA